MKYNEWIKASEQLPPEPVKLYDTEYYLVTIVNEQVIPVIYTKTKIRNKETIRWEWNGSLCPWDIIAWMPFPEPYKE